MTSRPTAAERVLQGLGISDPAEINVDVIAEALGVVVRYREMDGAEATIVGGATRAVVAVNSKSPYTRRRFSVGHELGHWHHHRGRCLLCASSTIGRFDPKSTREREADGFAADLLLPNYLVRPYLLRMKAPTLTEVRAVADRFQTSLTPTLIKLVEADIFRMAIVCHGKTGRRWSRKSNSVEGWWRSRDDLDHESFAFGLLHGEADEDKFPRRIGADAWFEFQGADRHEVNEQSFRLPNDEILTVLRILD